MCSINRQSIFGLSKLVDEMTRLELGLLNIKFDLTRKCDHNYIFDKYEKGKT